MRNENDRPLLEFELEKVVRGFFAPELLLDYLRYFMLFEQGDDGIIKKIAGYHQFHAVREAVRATVIAATQPQAASSKAQEERATYGKRVVPGSRKGGIVWHTQGSGKSISMVCFAGKLMQQPEMQNPTMVVVTDRNDLDGQLFQTFVGARSLLKETPQQAEDRDELRALLAGRPSGGIIFTTVQKFSPEKDEDAVPACCPNEPTSWSSPTRRTARSTAFARCWTRRPASTSTALPSTCATRCRTRPSSASPARRWRPTTRTPARCSATTSASTTFRMRWTTAPRCRSTTKAAWPSWTSTRPRSSSSTTRSRRCSRTKKTSPLREAAKTKWAALEKLVGAEPRIEQVAADIVQHFEARTAAVEGKAHDRGDEPRDLRPALRRHRRAAAGLGTATDPAQGAIKVVMTGSAADNALLQPHIYNATTKKRLEKRFKDPKDPLKLVIVRDMWLTGFDVPCLHTMYVDKPMRDHNLMQAIARVNRVFHDKEGGLVVDYIGIAAELRRALQDLHREPGKGQPTLDAAEALAKLQGTDGRGARPDARLRLRRLPRPRPPHCCCRPPTIVLGLEDGKKRWFDVVLAITKAFSLCGTLDEAVALREEIAFFQAIKAVIAKATETDKKLSEDRKNAVLKQILDNAVVAEGVEDIFKLAGLDRPDIGILSDAFLEEVRQLPQRNFAVELLQKLLNDEIKSRSRTNVVLEKKFSDRLLAALNRYRSRAIESAQVIEELIADGQGVPRGGQARREPGAQRIRAGLLRRAGRQRERGARAGRRHPEEDRHRD